MLRATRGKSRLKVINLKMPPKAAKKGAKAGEPTADQKKMDLKKIETSFKGKKLAEGKHAYVELSDDDSKVRKYEYKDDKWEFVSIIDVDDVSDASDDESDAEESDTEETKEVESEEEDEVKPEPVKKPAEKKKRATLADAGAKIVHFVDEEFDNKSKTEVKEWLNVFLKEFNLRKKKRAKSAYQEFMSEKMLALTDIPSKDRMKEASRMWGEHKAKLEAAKA